MIMNRLLTAVSFNRSPGLEEPALGHVQRIEGIMTTRFRPAGLTGRSAGKGGRVACCAIFSFRTCRISPDADPRTAGLDALRGHQERTTTTLPGARPSPT
jgi:hypothetical protein